MDHHIRACWKPLKSTLLIQRNDALILWVWMSWHVCICGWFGSCVRVLQMSPLVKNRSKLGWEVSAWPYINSVPHGEYGCVGINKSIKIKYGLFKLCCSFKLNLWRPCGNANNLLTKSRFENSCWNKLHININIRWKQQYSPSPNWNFFIIFKSIIESNISWSFKLNQQRFK